MVDRQRKRKPLTDNQRELVQKGGRQQAQRTRWENSPEGTARMRDVRDLVGVPKPDAQGRGGYTLGQMYAVEGWNQGGLEQGMDASHNVHDDQPHLPGLENQEAAPLHMIDRARKRGAERWEDLSPRDQETTARNVRASSGATLESMTSSYGAQLDQAMVRASDRGQYPPQFYGGGEPNEVVTKTADDLKISRGAVSALHADNSPQTSFAVGQGPTRRYPQDEMARSAVSSAQRRGGAVQELSTSELAGDRPPGAMGYKENFAKSVRRADQIVNEGTPAGETNPNKTAAGYGPKTGPYQRAWTGGTSSQFVSDVHSGGGGMVPHLGTSKVTETGSSEREDALTTSGFHLMADKAARDAHRARGVHAPVKRGQEAQWVEEQIQRPDLPQTEESIFGPGHVDRDPLTGRPQRRVAPADPRQMRMDF